MPSVSKTKLLIVGAGAAAGAAAYVVTRTRAGRKDAGASANADEIAQAPTAPPIAEKDEIPETKPKAETEPGPEAEAKPKAESEPQPEPASEGVTTGTDAPPKPEHEPGNISGNKGPHQALNNPVGEPDETEYPDPFEVREDPLNPSTDGDLPEEAPHTPTGAESTSEPHPQEDPEAGDRATPPDRDKLDE